jgi:hypothetical protein
LNALNLTKIATAVALTLAPLPVYAQSGAAPLGGDVRAAATLESPNALEGEGTPVLLGIILIVLFAMVAVADSGDDVDNTPASP